MTDDGDFEPEAEEQMVKDEYVDFGSLKAKVRHFVRERDWEKYHNPKDLAVAISVEAAELLEHFLWEETAGGRIEGERAAAVREELADVVIYCLSFANAQRWDLSDAIMEKVERNRRKYPAREFKGVARLR